MKKVIVTVLFAAAAAPAHADPKPELDGVSYWHYEIKDGSVQNNPAPESLDGCLAAVEEARKKGMTEIGPYHETAGDKGRYLTLAQAEALCRESLFYRDVLIKDIAEFMWMDRAFLYLHNDVDVSFSKDVLTHADACDKAVAALAAAKVDPATPFKVGVTTTRTQTVADLKPKLCDQGRAEAQKYVKDKDKEKEPFLKAGIKGDKLAFMLEYDGHVFLPGQNSSDDLKKYAAASVLFTSSTSDPDAADYVVHSVTKYTFKGNKLVKTTTKDYRKRRGEKLGGGPFH